MKYRVRVVMSYWDTVVLEAMNEDEAKDKALEAFNFSRVVQGDGEVHSIEQIEETT